ncbi:hypothetical protein N2605_27505 [Bradyrhizobium yuanmingense]|uniref:hypothetical protein n=1 Tax=Bradyrhizobium yuanmingense TaxID=108015 RepID=UPI0021A72C4C|nr:hypothetical protein [Bradyrhizobium sp. CB1024]UWU83247.1 hypothetical protein N2605_27505 [Bradyrhizobium sp. CB1024]
MAPPLNENHRTTSDTNAVSSGLPRADTRAFAWSRLSALALLLQLFGASGIASASPPVLEGLQAPSQVPRGLVLVQGTNLGKARIIWDANSPNPKVLHGAVQGAVMFSIPPGVSPGSYAVAIENDEGRSSPVTMTITGAAPAALPRIDDISLLDTRFDDGGRVRCVLYIQGANVDVGATVLVDGVERTSDAHKALFNNMFGANPAVLGFPIRHYLSRVVPLDSFPAGSEIRVQLRNELGELSLERIFKLPLDASSLDSDGDGIPDVVEINGYLGSEPGSTLVDIKALGADPFRKDIFVEADVMEGVLYRPIERLGATPGTFDIAREMFANAPILNPFGPNGINLFVDSSGSVPSWELLEFRSRHDLATRTASFALLKQDHFSPSRRGLFHYAIWARAHPLGWSGESNIDFDGSKVGNDFMVTLGDAPVQYQTLKSQAATFAHELGHNLGQRHGGTNHSRFKPNYWSVMSYAWQLRMSQADAFRRRYPTCTPVYYATDGAEEVDGTVPQVAGFVIDYSEGIGPELAPNAGSLNEQVGVCGSPIDWNKNGVIDSQYVTAVIDEDEPAATKVTDHPNWPNLRFDGPRLGGRVTP